MSGKAYESYQYTMGRHAHRVTIKYTGRQGIGKTELIGLSLAGHDEGARYSEAIRGANAMRRKAWSRSLTDIPLRRFAERDFGCPVGFTSVLANIDVSRMTVGELTEAYGK